MANEGMLTQMTSDALPGARKVQSVAATSKASRHTRRRLMGSAVGAAALAACGPIAPRPQPASEAAGKINFWHWGSQDYFVRYRTLADEFQKRFPRIAVEVTLHASGMGEKLVASLAGGAPPETFVIDFQWAQRYGKQGFVEVIDDRAKKSRVLKLGEYHKLAADAISYKGKWIGLPGVGIPGGSAPNLIFYNSEHFRQAGLVTPYELWKQDKWTWQAFVQAAERLVKRGADGKMTTVPVEGYQHRLWMNTAGGKEVDDVFAPTRCLYDQPQAIKALQFVQDLRHRHRVESASGIRNEIGLDADQGFMEGRISMRFRWTTGINVYRPVTAFKWGLAPYPKDVTYANDYTAAGLAISKGIQQLEPSWLWIEWASGPDGQKIDARTTTGVPFNPEAQKVFLDSLKEIPRLETPDTPGELISKARHSFLRLLSVDEQQIRTQVIDPEMNKLWRNEANAQTVGRSIAQAVNEFLRATPQT